MGGRQGLKGSNAQTVHKYNFPSAQANLWDHAATSLVVSQLSKFFRMQLLWAQALRIWKWTLFSSVAIIGISGCGTSTPSPENSAWEGLVSSFSSTDPTQGAPLNPSGWYLKVQAPDSPPALLAFGYSESHTNPPTEVWFSGGGQYVKIQAGRIVATHGLPIDWKDARAEPGWPHWSEVAKKEVRATRIRSNQTNYDYGVRDEIRISSSPPPNTPISTLVPGAGDAQTKHWRWFEETVVNSTRQKLPPSQFATAHIGGVTVVAYSRQCLAENYCLHLMRWPQLDSETHPW